MKSRELKKSEQVHYFAPVAPADDAGKATREMLPLAPFVVSGGRNTERYYFIHVNALSAKACLAREMKEKGKHSYTKVFKAFE